ncbi:MAG TPA: DUF3592 domain-containing protein [Gemmatimonadaceae bacterium]|nr:DUF3592 domain-containing protein [Gemmatimonadaceae bacterium]
MKIVARTSSELIIRDSAATLRYLGAFFGALGAFSIWMGVFNRADEQIGAAPVAIGALIVLAGGAMALLPWRKTFAFSKTERVFVMAKERFGRVERQTIPLRDIADVLLEESTSSDSGSTYRVAVTLADQRRIPWTSYYTSGLASKQAVVDAARDFLALAPALGPRDLAAKRAKDAKNSRTALVVMGAFCCVFLAFGGTMLAKEQRRLSVFLPVTATVLSTRVEEHSDSDGSTYEPVVVYRYRVQDREYTASRVTPLKESRSGRWASRVANRYAVGSDYTAYYDPENPSEAFLLRSRSVVAWAFVGIPLVGLLLIFAGVRANRDSARMSTLGDRVRR